MATFASILRRFNFREPTIESFLEEVKPRRSLSSDGLQEVRNKIHLGAIPAELSREQFKPGLVVAYRSRRGWRICVVEEEVARKKVPLRPVDASYSISRRISSRRRWYAAA